MKDFKLIKQFESEKFSPLAFYTIGKRGQILINCRLYENPNLTGTNSKFLYLYETDIQKILEYHRQSKGTIFRLCSGQRQKFLPVFSEVTKENLYTIHT